MKSFTVSLAAFFLGIFFLADSGLAHAMSVDIIGNAFVDDFTVQSDRFRGHWRKGKRWNGFLCNGFYHYDVSLQGNIIDLDMDVNEKGGIAVRAQLKNIDSRTSGRYKSSYSACLTLASGVTVRVNWMDIDAEVEFIEKPSGEMKLVVEIKRTLLGRISFSRPLPDWFEYFLTALVNRAAREVWQSQLGDMLENRLSEYFSKKLRMP